jgi:hypothetical protein
LALSYLGSAAHLGAERLLALCLVNDNVTGLTVPLGAERESLLLVIAKRFVERPEASHVPLPFRAGLLSAVAIACQQLQHHPYTTTPTYNLSTLFAGLVEFSKSCLFPNLRRVQVRGRRSGGGVEGNCLVCFLGQRVLGNKCP